MKKLSKRSLTLTLALTMLVSSMQVESVWAEETEVNSNNLVDVLEETDIVEYDDEEIVYDEEDIYDFIKKIDMSDINEEAKKSGLVPMTV